MPVEILAGLSACTGGVVLSPADRGCDTSTGAIYLRQPAFRNAAGDREGRVEDITNIVAHDLPQQMAGGPRLQPVILTQAAHHFGRCMLQSLI